jgi:hypothetical protein
MRFHWKNFSGNFFMTSGNEVPLRVAASYSQVQVQTDHRLVKCIAEQIGDNKIDAAGFDPLVTLHSVSEKDPGKMDGVIRIFAGIADTQNCAIDLSHHTRKLAAGSDSDAYDIDDVRGVKAITDAMRAVRLLNYMSAKDAENAGLLDLPFPHRPRQGELLTARKNRNLAEIRQRRPPKRGRRGRDSLTTPLAFMKAWTKALETPTSPARFPPAAPRLGPNSGGCRTDWTQIQNRNRKENKKSRSQQ